jgi:hypothetical protein
MVSSNIDRQDTINLCSHGSHLGGTRGEILLQESRDDMAARSAGPAHCHGDQLVRAKDPGVDPVVLIGLRFCSALSFSFP